MQPPNEPADGTPSERTDTPGAPLAWGDTLCGLSELQLAVLQLLASGYTDAEIQERYQLTTDALRQEVTAAQRRLGARTKLQAIAKAFRGGWIS
jgi:DNA-binding NarL/FixJ family response regulator